MEVSEITIETRNSKRYFKCYDFAEFVSGVRKQNVREFMATDFAVYTGSFERGEFGALFLDSNLLLKNYENDMINKKYRAKTKEFLEYLKLISKERNFSIKEIDKRSDELNQILTEVRNLVSENNNQDAIKLIKFQLIAIFAVWVAILLTIYFS